MDYIKVQGAEHPIRFSLNTIRLFCKDKGIELSDFDMLFGEKANTIEGLDSLGLFIWYAFKEGARKEGKEFAWEVDDIFDFMSDEKGFIDKVMKVYGGSQGNVGSPQGEG